MSRYLESCVSIGLHRRRLYLVATRRVHHKAAYVCSCPLVIGWSYNLAIASCLRFFSAHFYFPLRKMHLNSNLSCVCDFSSCFIIFSTITRWLSSGFGQFSPGQWPQRLFLSTFHTISERSPFLFALPASRLFLALLFGHVQTSALQDACAGGLGVKALEKSPHLLNSARCHQ